MTVLYRSFARFLPVLFGLALFISLGAQAQTYTVEGVEVDVTASNAVEAREKALEEAQVKAFEMLVEQNVSEAARAAYTMPDSGTIMSLVKDFEVTNEQLSAVRYKGIFTVRFHPSYTARYLGAPVESTLTQESAVVPAQEFAPVSQPVLAGGMLVLPFYQEAQGQSSLWEPQNPWRAAWIRDHSAAFVVPGGDASDRMAIRGDQPLTYNPARLTQLEGRYRAAGSYIVLAAPQYQNNRLSSLTISLYRAGETGPNYLQSFALPASDYMSSEQFYDEAVRRAKSMLNSRAAPTRSILPREAQKETAPFETVTVNEVAPVQETGGQGSSLARVRFSTVQEWVRLKALLEKPGAVRLERVVTLKPREALIRLNHTGSSAAAQSALSSAGFRVSPVQSIMVDAASPVFEIRSGDNTARF